MYPYNSFAVGIFIIRFVVVKLKFESLRWGGPRVLPRDEKDYQFANYGGTEDTCRADPADATKPILSVRHDASEDIYLCTGPYNLEKQDMTGHD